MPVSWLIAAGTPLLSRTERSRKARVEGPDRNRSRGCRLVSRPGFGRRPGHLTAGFTVLDSAIARLSAEDGSAGTTGRVALSASLVPAGAVRSWTPGSHPDHAGPFPGFRPATVRFRGSTGGPDAPRHRVGIQIAVRYRKRNRTDQGSRGQYRFRRSCCRIPDRRTPFRRDVARRCRTCRGDHRRDPAGPPACRRIGVVRSAGCLPGSPGACRPFARPSRGCR